VNSILAQPLRREHIRARLACGRSGRARIYRRPFLGQWKPHGRADRSKESGEVAALKNDARVEAGEVAGRAGSMAETVSIAQEKK